MRKDGACLLLVSTLTFFYSIFCGIFNCGDIYSQDIK